MNRSIKRAISVLLLLALLSSFAINAVAADHKAILKENSGYGNCSIVLDYSGTGTVINGDVASEEYATITADGNYVNVPVYKGKYVKGRGASWSKWSSWSVENIKRNPDFTIYNGSGKATEYEVQSRTEYKYKHLKKTAVYATKYYTKYQGNKWYNRTVTITTSSWDWYPGVKSNYNIVQRYTTRELKNYTYVEEYDTEWRTKAPSLILGDKPWEKYTSRVTYRYRSRTLTWDAKALVSYEQVPSRYSLFDKQGNPINYGIKWSYSQALSQDKDYSFCIPGVYDKYIHVEEYYIPVAVLLNLLQEKIDITDGAFEKNSALDLFDKKLEEIEDGNPMEWAVIAETVSPVIEEICPEIVEKIPAIADIIKAINASDTATPTTFSGEGFAVTILMTLMEIADYITSQQKEKEINSLQEFVELVNKSVDRKAVVVIRFASYRDRSCIGMNSDNFYSNYENSGTSVYSIDATVVEDLEYVSMKLGANPFGGWFYASKDNNYGSVQYLNENNQNQICYALEKHFENKYKMIFPWNY